MDILLKRDEISNRISFVERQIAYIDQAKAIVIGLNATRVVLKEYLELLESLREDALTKA